MPKTRGKRRNREDKRNKKIRDMWNTRLYTKAEIGRQIGLSTERIRQILEQYELDEPIMSDELDWETLGKIRHILRIPFKNSTHQQLENQNGIYASSRQSIKAVEYYVYVLYRSLERLIELEQLLEELDMSAEEGAI